MRVKNGVLCRPNGNWSWYSFLSGERARYVEGVLHYLCGTKKLVFHVKFTFIIYRSIKNYLSFFLLIDKFVDNLHHVEYTMRCLLFIFKFNSIKYWVLCIPAHFTDKCSLPQNLTETEHDSLVCFSYIAKFLTLLQN